MRYQDAYEIIRGALRNADTGLPLTGSFLSNFFDRHVKDIGLRVVRDRRSFNLTLSGTGPYMISEDDFTYRLYKIETSQGDDKVLVPFVPEASLHTGVSTDNVSHIGYYTSHLASKSGTITGATSASPCVITSANSLVVGDYVIISEMTGTGIAGEIHPLNNKRHKVTAADETTFTISTSTAGMTSYSANGGVWTQDSWSINFTKSPEGTTTVYYYAKPRDKNSDKSMIDLPDSLMSAPIYRCIAELLNLNGNLQLGSGYIGLAEKLEKDYLQLTATKKSKPYLLSQPLQEFL